MGDPIERLSSLNGWVAPSFTLLARTGHRPLGATRATPDSPARRRSSNLSRQNKTALPSVQIFRTLGEGNTQKADRAGAIQQCAQIGAIKQNPLQKPRNLWKTKMTPGVGGVWRCAGLSQASGGRADREIGGGLVPRYARHRNHQLALGAVQGSGQASAQGGQECV